MNLPKICNKAPVEIELKARTTYAFCPCGLSEKQPFCDGSHKGTGYKSLKFTPLRDETVYLCLCKHSKNLPFCDGSHSDI